MLKEVFFGERRVPTTWYIPRQERALLAIISVIFWTATLGHAITHDASGTSVFALFGLGLFYLVFSLWNLLGGLHVALQKHALGHVEASHPRSLTELFIVLFSMLVCNVAVLAIYLAKGTSFTVVDSVSLGIDAVLLGILALGYGYRELFTHPIARGWLAVAGKTIPQIIVAGLFIAQPGAASGLALLTLLGIDVLSGLRFIPTVKSYLHDPDNQHLRGLLLGETGNVLSGLLLTFAWLVAHSVSQVG